jgi:predicted dehydrogenase
VTVRWGFLGAGWIADRALAPALAEADGAVLQAVAARDPERARALGPVTVHRSYQDLVDDPDVDAVYISLTNEMHLPWTLAAIAAGKHVLCEKPFCLTADEVDQVVDAAGDRTVVEASWYRWHPRVRLAQEHLERIGPVRHVTAAFRFDAGSGLEGNYRLEPERGGGALYDVGHYAVSAALWAVGAGLPQDVAVRQQRASTGVDLVTEAVLDWDGATAEIQVGFDADVGQWLVITGEDGEIELRGDAFTAWKDDETELLVSDGRSTERTAVPAENAYRVMLEEVSSVIAGGPGWVLPLEQSRLTAAALDQIRAAAAG